MRKAFVALLALYISIILAQPAIASVSEKQEFRDKHYDSKKEFNNAISGYKNARDTYNKAKQDLENVKGRERLGLHEKAKEFVMHADKAAIRYLESLKSKVQLVQDIPDEKRNKMIAEIDRDIEWLVAAQTNIKNAENMDELRFVAREIREQWRQYRGSSKRMAGEVLTAKIANIISQGEEVSIKVAQLKEDFNSQGKDTLRLEQLISEFNGSLSRAREKNTVAQEKFAGIKSIRDANMVFKEGVKLIKEAHRELKEAHGIMVDIGKEVRVLEDNK